MDLKLFERFKRTFTALNMLQQIAVGVLVLSVPLAVTLGVSALSSSINAMPPLLPTSMAESASIISIIQSISEENSSSSNFQSTSALGTTSKGPVVVSLKPSSLEEDLEVEIVNAKGELVTSAVFKLTVKSKTGSYNKTWSVDDGFLRLKKIDSGDYTISIEDVKGYQIPVKTVDITVKAKIKHEKIDVSDKIKDESQIDVSKEDVTKPPVVASPPPAAPSYPAGNATAKKTTIVTSYKYKIAISKNDFLEANVGYVLNADGSKSQYVAEVDSNGYLIGEIKMAKTASQNATVSNRSNKIITGDMLSGTVYRAPYTVMNLGITDDGTQVAPDTTTPDSTAPESSSTESSSTESSSTESSSTESSSTESSSTESSSTESSSTESSSTDSSSSNSTTKPSIKDITDTVPNLFITEKVDGKDVVKMNPEILKGLNIVPENGTVVVVETLINGWSADGKSYYDANGNKIKGQANIGGSLFNFDSNGIIVKGTLKGIDISKYQRNIDWKAVKASGIDFVIIRAGYRGYGTGALVEDPLFKSHMQGATSVGLKIGVYFFTQAITVEEAVEEASMALQLVQGYNITYPIFFDTEYVGNGARADSMSKFHRTLLARVFCNTVLNSGYKAGVYASKSWFYNQLLFEDFPSTYEIWLAHYTSATDFRHRYNMWQYTSTASVPGISGGVDMNWSYKNY